MPRPLSRKKRIVYFSLFVLFFIVAIPVLLLYSSGYSFDNNAFTLSWRGGIYVYVPQTAASVYIGNDLKEITSLFKKEVIVKDLRPDNYLVLVSHDDFWPWAKFVTVKRGEVSARYPLLVPKVIPFVEIERTATSDRASARALFAATASTTLVSKNIRLWVDGDIIRAAWLGSVEARPYYFCVNYPKTACPRDIPIYQSTSPIRALDFYPNRDDALLITIGDSVYATEIDPMVYRNSYPIFRGTKPEVKVSRGSVYIKDGDYIASAEF